MKFKRNNFFCAAVISCVLVFASCSPEVKIQINPNDSTAAKVSLDFSKMNMEEFSELLEFAGAETSSGGEISSFVSENDLKFAFESAGFKNVKSHVSENNISASGEIPKSSIKNSRSSVETSKSSECAFVEYGILKITGNSAVFTLGPEKFMQIYNSLDEETSGYIDLLMIPALIGEEFTVPEYSELLASLYGKEFAQSIVNSSVKITLAAPDGKRTVTEKITLGELFTLTKDREWTVKW